MPFRRRQRPIELRQRPDEALSEPIEDAAIAPSNCLVTAKHQRNVAVFCLQGELDLATSKQVRILLAASVEEAAVLLDLGDLTVVDLEGVAILRDVIRCVYEHGGQVAIARPWRLAGALPGLLDAEGLVLVALSAASGIAWLGEHPVQEKVTVSPCS